MWLVILSKTTFLNAINAPHKFLDVILQGDSIKSTYWRKGPFKVRLHGGGMSVIGIQRAGRKFVAYG